jgi:hypothetical protein
LGLPLDRASELALDDRNARLRLRRARGDH